MRPDPDPAAGHDLGFGTVGAGAPRRPGCGLRGGVEDAAPARIGNVALPELVGIQACEVGELIDRLLGGERE